MVRQALVAAAQAFASRVGNEEDRTKLGDLSKEVELLLGKDAIGALTGVYNPARLYRFLLGNRMDVQDAKQAVVLNDNSRAQFEMDAKRDAIGKFQRCSISLLTPPPIPKGERERERTYANTSFQ